jgi:tape measure domain-containing protein
MLHGTYKIEKTMAGLHFDITGDNSNFLRKLHETESGVNNTSRLIEQSGVSIEQIFGRMTTAAAAFGVSIGAKELISDIARVRGEFQQLEVAFNTMLGSKEQADTLMSQLVYTAAKTPFDLQGVANGAKQLLAYGTAAEDVNETLVRLGDIAAGLSIPLNDLVWLYGTTMTQGRLFTQDLRQFQGRGIPLADELAKQFGITKDKVGELVTAGKVGFPEVQKAIESMTNEGGKFGGLMESQSKTITGQISNIQDSISTMFNEIGKENENVIDSALSGASYLVEHWKEVAITIESAAIAYGTYKAAVMTMAALQGVERTLKVDAEIEGLKSLLTIKEESKNADLEAAVASGTLTQAKAAQIVALREELATRLTVLKVKKEEAIIEQTSALSAFNAAKLASEKANEKLEKMEALYQAALAQGDASYEQYAMEQLQTASAKANTAATALNTAEKNLNAASSKRKVASEALDTMATQANTIANHANTASMNIMKLACIQLTAMLKRMWATLMANPLLLVTGAVIGLGYALYKVATAESEAETAIRMYNETLDEQQKKQNEYKDNIDKLIKAIEDNNKSEGERLQAFEALKAEYPTILDNLLTEAEYLKEIAKYKKLIADEDNNRSKQSDVEILEEEKQKLKYYQDVRKKGTSTTLVDMDGNGWATDNVEDAIKAQQAIVNKAIAKVASHDVTSFLGNIQNMKDSDIVSVINAINLSLKAIGKNGDDAIAIVAELGGEFSKTQLSIIKNALETEQESRSGEKNTGKEWIEKYKNNYLNAKKELDDFLNTENKLTETEYEKKLKELTEKKDEAEKKYQSVGGVIGSKADKQQLDRLKQQEQLAEQLLSLRRKNQQAEIGLMKEGTEKELKQIDLDYQKKLDAIKKKEKELSERQGGKLTQEQSIEISALYINAENERDKAIADVTKNQLKTEADAMREYLKEYGTFQQKKEAITKEYNDKIANATTEGDKKILQKQMEEALSSVDMDKLKQEINWELIFSDLNKVSKKSLEQVKQQLKTFKNSDEYKNMAVDQKKVIDEALNNMQSTIIDKGGLLGDLPEQLDALRIAQDELKQAQDEYNKSLKSGTDAEKEAALKKKNKAEKNVQNAETNVTRSADKTYQNLITLADTITQLGSSSEMSLSQIGSLASGLIDTFTEAGSKIGGIVGAVFSLLDGIEKQGFDGFVKNVFSSVFGAGASMWNTITFGGFNKLFGIGGNAKEVQDTIDRLTDRNETLQTAIEDLTDVMEASKGTKSVAAYTDAKKLQEETEENYKKIAQEQARYSNSHHSWNYYWGGFNQDEIARLSSQIGRNWNGDIWSLSPEEMKMLRSNVDMWEKIQNTGKGDYGGRLTEKLNDYIDQAGKMEELTNKLYEGLTGISFESMYDSFIDTLMDMDASAEDAADNIADYFMRAMLSNKIGELYSEKLKAWWEKFGKSMEDNELTESEREALQNEYMQYVEEAMKIRDEIAAATGYTGSSSSSSQEASKKGFATASQDSIDELNGRFTALQIVNEEIKNAMLSIYATMNQISVSTGSGNVTLGEIKNLVISSNGYLEDIAGYTKKILDNFSIKLDSINQNIEKKL